jgi:hypothetical protein
VFTRVQFLSVAAAALLAASQSAGAQDTGPPKLAEYSTIVNRVGGEMFASTPETWDYGVLTIQSDGTQLTYQLKNQHSSDRAEISPELMAAIDELYVTMRSQGDTWTAARFEFRKVAGDVKIDTSFTYADK